MTATEGLYSVIKSSPTIYRLVHCIHTTYNIQKHWQKLNYVQNHININININLLYEYGILKITVLLDMCATFALGALYNF